jgi:hypothetical protein
MLFALLVWTYTAIKGFHTMNFIEVRHESTLEIVLHHFAVLLWPAARRPAWWSRMSVNKAENNEALLRLSNSDLRSLRPA